MACAAEQQPCVYHKGGCCNGLTCHCDASGNPVPATYTGARTCCPGEDTGDFDTAEAQHQAALAGVLAPAPAAAAPSNPSVTTPATAPATPPLVPGGTDQFTQFIKLHPFEAVAGALLIGLVLSRR